MAREPALKRRSSQLFGDGLQFLIPVEGRAPRIRPELEVKLMGVPAVATIVKRNRLKIKELEQQTNGLIDVLDRVWPRKLYGIDLPGFVHVLHPTRMRKRGIGLAKGLEKITGKREGLASRVTIDVPHGVDPGALAAAIADTCGKETLMTASAEWDRNALKEAESDGRIESADAFFTDEAAGAEWRITVYGPNGETLNSSAEFDQFDRAPHATDS